MVQRQGLPALLLHRSLIARTRRRAGDRGRGPAPRAGLAGRVDFVEAAAPFSFAYGLTRPRVAVSGGLLGSAFEHELDAVLTHERHHVANRDPLEVRVAQLETGEEPPLATVPTSAVVLIGAVLAVVFVATLLVAGPEVVGPMDGSGMDGGADPFLLDWRLPTGGITGGGASVQESALPGHTPPAYNGKRRSEDVP